MLGKNRIDGHDLKSPSSQKCDFPLVRTVACLSITVQIDAHAEFDTRRLFFFFTLLCCRRQIFSVLVGNLILGVGTMSMICDIANRKPSVNQSDIQHTQVWCGHLDPPVHKHWETSCVQQLKVLFIRKIEFWISFPAHQWMMLWDCDSIINIS